MFNKDNAKHMADLSMLTLTNEELDSVIGYMSSVTEMINIVHNFSLDTDLNPCSPVPYTDLRTDEHSQSCPQDKILRNTDNTKDNYFTVPKIV